MFCSSPPQFPVRKLNIPPLAVPRQACGGLADPRPNQDPWLPTVCNSSFAWMGISSDCYYRLQYVAHHGGAKLSHSWGICRSIVDKQERRGKQWGSPTM